MLIPALFVAEAVGKAALPIGPTFDIIVFVPPEDVDSSHRDWAAERRIALRHDIDLASVRDIAILQSRLSPATLMKLLAPAQLAGRYDKLLYLDADLVIEEDVSALFRLDMGDCPVAAVPSGRLWAAATDAEKHQWLVHFCDLGMTAPYRYFNAGVLLIDIASWSREGLTGKALDFIRSNPSLCLLPDEDALNGVLDGHFIELSYIWNATPGLLSTSGGDLRPVIVHHAGPLKPWMRFKKGKGLLQDRQAYRRYRDFIGRTPWPGWLAQQWTGRDLAGAVRHQVKGLVNRLRGKEQGLSATERGGRQAALRQYLADARFADIEQGIALREGCRLRLAPAPPRAGPADAMSRPGARASLAAANGR
jgi:hypothetical protein